MPWFPELEAVVRAALSDAGARDRPSANVSWTCDDPSWGHVAGHALERYTAESAEWLRARKAAPSPGPVTHGADRTVAEFDLGLTVRGERIVLPVAAAIEPGAFGAPAAVRIYHSQWPLLGHHVVRAPLLQRDPDAHESDVVGRYQAALAAGDTDAITDCFEDDGCFREPAGPQFRVCGRESLRSFFAGFFSNGGGIVLEHCTVTEDGVRTALEFNAVRWGSVDMPHQAGIAIYERGATGRLAHARIYDDVDPPI